MKLINLNSKKGVVNLFADYILKKFDKQSKTIIKVTDFGHFLIVNGSSDSENILNLSEILDQFISENQTMLKSLGYKESIGIMDLIKYNDKKIEEEKNLWVNLYNSDRPIYHQELYYHKFESSNVLSLTFENRIVKEVLEHEEGLYIKSNPQVTSEFPFGYSLPMGRTLMYYSEYIMFNIMDSTMTNEMKMFISKEKSDENENKLNIIDVKGVLNVEKLKSNILDLFDFNFEYFESKFSEYDFCEDLKKPFEPKPWLIKDVETVGLFHV